MKKLLLSLALLPFASVANAAPASGSMPVSTDIRGNCIVTAPAVIDFGGFDPTGAHLTVNLKESFMIGVQCTNGTPQAIVYIDKGKNDETGCSSSERRMKGATTRNASSYLRYTITKGTTGTDGWACTEGTNANGGIAVGPFTDGSMVISTSASGSVLSGQTTAIVGSYEDSINIYVAF